MSARAATSETTGLPLRGDLDVLVVDDDLAQAEELAELLRHEGLTTLAVEDAGDAMNIFLDCRPRLLLVDINMPVCDGVKLAVLASALDARVAIVLMSADPDAVTRGFSASGILGVVDKPIEPAMLCRVAHAITGRRSDAAAAPAAALVRPLQPQG